MSEQTLKRNFPRIDLGGSPKSILGQAPWTCYLFKHHHHQYRRTRWRIKWKVLRWSLGLSRLRKTTIWNSINATFQDWPMMFLWISICIASRSKISPPTSLLHQPANHKWNHDLRHRPWIRALLEMLIISISVFSQTRCTMKSLERLSLRSNEVNGFILYTTRFYAWFHHRLKNFKFISMTSNDKLLHICKVEKLVNANHYKIAPHDEFTMCAIFLWFTMFWRNIHFVPIYSLLCGAKMNSTFSSVEQKWQISWILSHSTLFDIVSTTPSESKIIWDRK